MIYDWDAKKAKATLEKHGMPFKMAAKVFLDPDSVIVVDDRFDYGEVRYVIYGRIENRLYSVVYTQNEATQTLRIISARKANQREMKRHDHS